MMTLSVSGLGDVPSVIGEFGVSACQPQARPMVTLVVPVGFIDLDLR